jgi:hypothetical protein
MIVLALRPRKVDRLRYCFVVVEGTMVRSIVDLEVAEGIDLEQVEAVIRDALAAAAASQVTLRRRRQNLADPFTWLTVALGSGGGGAFLASIGRDLYRRYIRPKLDERFGPDMVRERRAERKQSQTRNTASKKQLADRKVARKKQAESRPAAKRKAPQRKKVSRDAKR